MTEMVTGIDLVEWQLSVSISRRRELISDRRWQPVANEAG